MYDEISSPDCYSPDGARQPPFTQPKRRQTLEQARMNRFRPSHHSDVNDTIGRQMRDLEDVKRQAGISGGSRSVSSSGLGSDWEGDASERVSDLKVQIDAAKRQLSVKEEKLKSLQAQLRKMDDRTQELAGLRRQKEDELSRLTRKQGQPPSAYKVNPVPQPENADLNVILQSEMKIRREAETRLVEEQAALRALKTNQEADLFRLREELQNTEAIAQSTTEQYTGKFEAVRLQMQAKLAKVREEMREQFNEERQKLESRVEYLTRMNDRKDQELDNLQQKKVKLNAILEQIKTSHKQTIQGFQGRFEHENKQTIQHESNAAKHEREHRMIQAEMVKLNDRLRKAGGSIPPTPRTKSPTATRRGTPSATPRYTK